MNELLTASTASTEIAHVRRGEPMSTVTTPRLHHIALTVSDVDASVRW